MYQIKQHTVFKIITFLLVVTLLVPTVVKFAHVFSHHEHEVCLGEAKTHLHEIDLDCEFYKFKLSNQYLHLFEYDDIINISSYFKIPILIYKFLNNHRQLSFSLRGPPVLV
ncbi:hypothetical protein GCM10022396_03080 [Flavivirga amylovorans]